MEGELNGLEQRVREVVDLCKRLRAENLELRQRHAQLENDNSRLREKLDTAIERIDALIRKLPESPS